MDKTVQIYEKNVYGTTLRYPANETAKLLINLTNQKTFSDSSLNIIHQLGYKVVLVAEINSFLTYPLELPKRK